MGPLRLHGSFSSLWRDGDHAPSAEWHFWSGQSRRTCARKRAPRLQPSRTNAKRTARTRTKEYNFWVPKKRRTDVCVLVFSEYRKNSGRSEECVLNKVRQFKKILLNRSSSHPPTENTVWRTPPRRPKYITSSHSAHCMRTFSQSEPTRLLSSLQGSSLSQQHRLRCHRIQGPYRQN